MVALLVLGAVLLQIFASGTPVAGDDSVAAVTAGINLGTAPAARIAPSERTASLRTPLFSTLLALLGLLLLADAGLEALARPHHDLQSILQRRTLGRRGPPTTA